MQLHMIVACYQKGCMVAIKMTKATNIPNFMQTRSMP